MDIHPTAVISPKAQLGEGVVVGPYAVIGENIKVGENTKIGAHTYLDGWTNIGKNCDIYPGAVIGTPSQDLKYKGAKSYVEIGDNVLIREYVTINRPTGAENYTKVGKNVVLLAYSHVAHECEVGDGVIMANSASLAGHVTVEEGAIIGGLTGIHQFCHVGKYSMIGGVSRVTMDVLPFCVAAGSPAAISGLNIRGLKRRNFSSQEIALLKRAYKFLFRSGLNVSMAADKIRAELEIIPPIEHLLNFIQRSKRGITKK